MQVTCRGVLTTVGALPAVSLWGSKIADGEQPRKVAVVGFRRAGPMASERAVVRILGTRRLEVGVKQIGPEIFRFQRFTVARALPTSLRVFETSCRGTKSAFGITTSAAAVSVSARPPFVVDVERSQRWNRSRRSAWIVALYGQSWGAMPALEHAMAYPKFPAVSWSPTSRQDVFYAKHVNEPRAKMPPDIDRGPRHSRSEEITWQWSTSNSSWTISTRSTSAGSTRGRSR